MRVLYWRELRTALREKSIVVNSLLIPAFLYPFLLWVAFTGLMFVVGQTQGFVARVRVFGFPTDQPGLRLTFEHDQGLQLIEAQTGLSPGLSNSPAASASAAHARFQERNSFHAGASGRALPLAERQVRSGQLDAVLEFLPPAATAARLPGNFRARIIYDQSRERSEAARNRLRGLLDEYRVEYLKREAARHGISPAQWQGFAIRTRNIASKREMGGFILGMIAPALFMVMVAVGCFYPAVDSTAGERERNTWETLISTAADRLNIVTAKYLYVATLGSLAGLLNLLAILVTLRPIFAPLLEQAGQHLESSIPLRAVPVAALGALLLAGFIAAGMMLFAAFARTFKEGQAMITPFYLLLVVPVVFLQAPGLKFTLSLALVPIANVVLMLRAAISGALHWAPLAVTIGVSVFLIAVCLRLAAFILQFEDIVLGSYQGSLLKFFRQHVLKHDRVR